MIVTPNVQTRRLAQIRAQTMKRAQTIAPITAQTKDPISALTRVLTMDQKNLRRADQTRAVLMTKDPIMGRKSPKKKMDHPTEKNPGLIAKEKSPAKRRGGLKNNALLRSLGGNHLRKVQRSQMNAHQKNRGHVKSPHRSGNWAANNQRKLGSLNVIIKRELREVALQTTKRKGVEVVVEIARTILLLDQSTLIVPTITLIILAGKAIAKRVT